MEYFGLVITYGGLGDYEIIGRGKRGFAVRRNINGINCVIKLPIDKHLLIYNKEEIGKTDIDNSEVKNIKYLSEISEQLDHFIKILGYIIFPNVTYEGKILKSIIYQDLGQLRKTQALLTKDVGNQLLEIFDEFRIFNLAGFLHTDTQGLNNIEINETGRLVVIDLDDYRLNKPDTFVTLRSEIGDLINNVSCIESCIKENPNGYISSEGNILVRILELYLERKPTAYKLYLVNKKYYNYEPIELIDILCERETYEYEQKELLIYKENMIKRLKSSNCNERFIEEITLLQENYFTNIERILSLLEEIERTIDDTKENKENIQIANHFHNSIINNFINRMNKYYFKFNDIKPIINEIYQELIEKYKIIVDQVEQTRTTKEAGVEAGVEAGLKAGVEAGVEAISFKQKYLKYKTKYLKLKNKN
jgi:hypothetical protein